jgi:cyclopropane-fatty-acyl-phospholipid synthase
MSIMATQDQISLTYDWMDGIFRLSLGEMADISGAYYDGDYSKTLEQAQKDKHNWILDGIDFRSGFRVLDVGCGWGNMLNSINQNGGNALGLTLSSAQERSCNRNGLEVVLRDWKDVRLGELGKFDAIISIGAFEHFCSIDEYLAAKQEKIYIDFFRFCASHLSNGGRMYLQTMTWGDRVPDIDKEVSLSAPEGTNAKILARLRLFYPGSWLPLGKEQVIECAYSHFQLNGQNSGRLDYIQTLEQWKKAANRCFIDCLKHPSKWTVIAKLGLNFFKDKAFLCRLKSYLCNDQREVFERCIFDHYRMFFEKK